MHMRVTAAIMFLALAAGARGDVSAQNTDAPILELREPAFIGQDSRLGFFSTDVSLAVGPRHFIVVRNSSITLHERTSQTHRQLSEVSLRTFLTAATHAEDRLTDPLVMFDPDNGRFWVVNSAINTCVAAESCDAGMQLAVSKTATPETLTEADWFFYRLDRALLRVNGQARRVISHGDYDKLALVGGRLLVSWQEAVTTAAGTQVSSIVRILDRDVMLSGTAPATWTDFVYEGSSRARLATMHDARDRAGDRAFYDLRGRCGAGGMVWTIGAVLDVSRSPRVETRDVTVPTACNGNSNATAPQPGSTMPIFVQHLSVQPAYRDGRLWVFESNGRDSANTTSEIVWAELDVRSWPDIRVVQSGRVSGGESWAYTAAAALDNAGNLALIYSQSGRDEFISIYYTGRMATDPPNTMRAPRLLKAGTRPFAWAGIGSPVMSFVDYPAVTIDYTDGSLWMAGILPTAQAPAEGRAEISDAWIGRLQGG